MVLAGRLLLRADDHVRNVAYLARAYLTIRRSGKFDCAHYGGQLPHVGHRGLVPLVHYLWSGERKGREPFPGFSPRSYRLLNEELIDSEISPLHHFVLQERRSQDA